MPGFDDPSAVAQGLGVSVDLLAGGRAVVRLSGELDLATAPLLEDALSMLLSAARVDIVVDAGDVTFCDCAALGVLVRTDRRLRASGGRIRLLRPCRSLRRVLAITALEDVLADTAPPPWAGDFDGRGRALLTGFADMTRALTAQPTLDDALGLLAPLCGRLLDAADDASVTVRRNGRYTTLAATGPLSERLDAVQYRSNAGPCVDAINDRAPAHAGDLEAEVRWGSFPERARENGVRGVLSVPLTFGEEPVFGSLNLYSRHSTFAEPAVLAATAMGACAVTALAAVRERQKIANLEKALQSNRDIGMAIGIIMARRAITPEEAFELLRTVSQHSQRKLADIAGEVVYTGKLYSSKRQQRA
jgi:anti-anti-sigma factor